MTSTGEEDKDKEGLEEEEGLDNVKNTGKDKVTLISKMQPTCSKC